MEHWLKMVERSFAGWAEVLSRGIFVNIRC